LRLIGSELTLHKLEILCTVARLEGVTRAAEALHIAQPVVTAHIRSLGDKLGVKLFIRQGRRVKITPEGARVLAWAEDVVSRTHELERELADSKRGQKGTAVIATSMTIGSYVIPEKIVAFRRGFPDGLVSVLPATPRAVVEAIRDGRADFGITILDPQQDVSELDINPIGEDELVLACRAGGQFDTPNVTLKDLERMPFISAQANSTRREVEDAALFKAGAVRRNFIFEFGHGEAMIRAVRADVGVAFLFKSSIGDELENASLKILALPGLRATVSIYLVKRTQKYFSGFQQKLFDYMSTAFR
jgi:LysR family transcriptional regulator, low CO2-responsive transcriptional regulator